jgi:hypothetical protein
MGRLEELRPRQQGDLRLEVELRRRHQRAGGRGGEKALGRTKSTWPAKPNPA